MKYTIRSFNEEDLNNLAKFFIKAYGSKTIFQDSIFLKWYFGFSQFEKKSFITSLIAVDKENEIVAHYGELRYALILNNTPVSFAWGVNAYTLPEWRGRGINSTFVNNMINRHDVFGVIGFTSKTASFYRELGFNTFENKRFNRYALNLNEKTFDIVKIIGQDFVKARSLFKPVNFEFSDGNVNVTEISRENIDNFYLNCEYPAAAVTQRDINFLKWRFFDNPYIKYHCIAYVLANKILSYAIIRVERLHSTDFYITRIIDLLGIKDYMPEVLCEVVLRAKGSGHIYIDFSSFGSAYGDVLEKHGFSFLRNEDAGLLPFVTCPVENRLNNEYIGLFSKKYKNEISRLTEKQIFFTRTDSDRDRLNNIDQISERKSAQ
ncbi:MAG: hypothetical protein Q7O04_07065 [Candidatus Omnitrophota bacterium]|nr:hypothetical protein [Candidatus Omnitrophota bacterium]